MQSELRAFKKQTKEQFCFIYFKTQLRSENEKIHVERNYSVNISFEDMSLFADKNSIHFPITSFLTTVYQYTLPHTILVLA